MRNDLPFVITISRQLGSGGAYLGQQLASRLSITYLDREILFHAAQELKISEADLHSRDERVTPRWQAWIEAMSHGYTQAYVPPMTDFLPTDQALFDAESKVIIRMSQAHSAVIVGQIWLLRSSGASPAFKCLFIRRSGFSTGARARVKSCFSAGGTEANQ